MEDITSSVERVTAVLQNNTANLEELNAISENILLESEKLTKMTSDFNNKQQ